MGWDTLESPTYRHELLPSYQSGREFDDDLLEQLRDLPDFVDALGFVVGKAAGFEADDFLATAVARQERKGGVSILASADRDMFQLASAHTTILQPAKGGEWVRIGPAEVRQRYGVEPSQVPDFIALRGDPSDKIPGAKGVGAATAAGLLRKYGTLEGMLEAGRFSEQADALKSYKQIATMDPQGAAAADPRTKADMAARGATRPRLGAEQTGRPARADGRRLSARALHSKPQAARVPAMSGPLMRAMNARARSGTPLRALAAAV